MNKKQKACLLVSIAAAVAMGLFPPWVIQSREMNKLGSGRYEYKYTIEPGPYSWIGTPPTHRLYHSSPLQLDVPKKSRARFIDLYRLGLQYFVVAVVTIGLVITFRDEKATKQ